MMKKNIAHSIVSAVCLSGISVCTFASTMDQLREQAILSIRQGDIAQGLGQLEKLRQEYPHDQKVLADYLLSLKHSNQLDNSKLYLLEEIKPTEFPNYAQIELVKHLRDLQKFALAAQWAQQFYHVNPDVQLKLLLAVTQAEAQQLKEAKQTLSEINLEALQPDQWLLMSYVYRQIGDVLTALQLAQKADQVLQTPVSQTEYYQSLIALESVDQALEQAKAAQLEQTNPKLYFSIQQAYFSQKIRQAIQIRDYRMYWAEKNANEPLDKILAEMQQYADHLDINNPQYRGFYYDLIYALSVRNQDQQAIAYHDRLQQKLSDIPNYTRQAIADAYLGLRQPQLAELVYKSLLSDPKYNNYNAYSGLYYAYIEQEKYQQAEDFLKQLDEKIPLLSTSEAIGSRPEVRGDRANYIHLLGLNDAYANRLEKAEKYYQDLLQVAPNNPNYINQLSTIQRWRNNPQQAQETLSQLDGMQPRLKNTYLNHMQNVQALGDIKQWRVDLNQLLEIDPDDTGVIRAQQELKDRDRFGISHSSGFGRSRADNQQMAKSLQGLNDRDSSTTVYAPWIKDNYRAFAQYRTQWSEYRQGEIEENRYGLGLEWAKDRKSLVAVFSQNDQQERSGVNLRWSQWLNDQWSYFVAVDSAADIPLQALLQKYSGESYQTGMTWQKNESRRIDASYKLTDIEDGNKRQEAMLSFSQGVWASPHHDTDLNFSTYYGQNSLKNAAYFNPKDNYSVEMNISHDWLTWRKYDKSFNQSFMFGVGVYGQDGFSSKPMYSAQYRHEWKLSRNWQLNYGVGWRMHPYDGEQEQRTYGMLGLEGKF